jgi:Cu-Zn family superoxide dismutase
MSWARRGKRIIRLVAVAGWVAAVPALALVVAPVSGQEVPKYLRGPAGAPLQAGGSAVEGLRKRFEAFLGGGAAEWRRAGSKQREDVFQAFLAWPNNPLEVQLTVRLTFPGGVGPTIGTLTIKNGEILVGGRKDVALFIRPEVHGLPGGLFAFHVHEHPDCGSAVKNGEHVPGLAAGSHLWLSGTGALSGKIFASHLGDLPDLKVDADGTARSLVVAARLSLADVAKRAFVIHASQDDTSDRLACAAFD